MDIKAYKINDYIGLVCPFEKKTLMHEIGAIWDYRKKLHLLNLDISSLEICKQNNFIISDELLFYFEEKEKKEIVIEKPKNNLHYKTKPHAHQKALVDLAYKKKKVFFLCDVGTGKTKAAIDSVIALGCKKTLVVTPAFIMENFQNEINIHSDYKSIVLKGTVEKRIKDLKREKDNNFYIINYDVLKQMEFFLTVYGFDAVIFDEIHYLKTPTALRSIAAYNIVQNIPIRIGLTGTLIANGYQDAFGPYKVIDDSIFGKNYWTFKKLYIETVDCVFGVKKFKKIVGNKNEDTFKHLIAKNSLKYSLNDIVDLPSEVHNPIYISLHEKTNKLYKETFQNPLMNPLEKALKLQRVTSGFVQEDNNFYSEKLSTLLDLLNNADGQVVIWCRFLFTMDKIAEKLKSKNITHCMLNGNVANKEEVLANFKNSNKIKILIAQIQLGVGWEIPNAKQSIFYEMDFSRINYVQSKGRNRRLKGSEKGSVVYTYLLMKNTIDMMIYKTLQTKDFTAKEALEYVGSH